MFMITNKVEYMPNNTLITIREAANTLTIRPNTLRAWISQGLVGSIKVGPLRRDSAGRDRRATRLRRADVLSLINENNPGRVA